MIKPVAAAGTWNAGAPCGPRETGPEHRLAQVMIMTTPTRQPALLRLLRPGEPLLGSVVVARNSKVSSWIAVATTDW